MLSEDSLNKGISLNSLVNSIFKRYLAWEKYADEIGFIPLSKQAVRLIFSNLDQKTTNKIATDIGRTIPRELTFLMFNRLDFSSIMSMIEISCTRFGILKHDITDSRHNLTLYHGVSKEFSQYVAWVFESMAEDLSLKLKVNNTDNNMLCIEIEEFNNKQK
ncbi:MAG: hypothetical protein ACREAE_06170 [Nitrosopumilaceae archaeon]